MTTLCYLIVCVNLLYSLVQAGSYSRPTTYQLRKLKQDLMLKTVNVENQHEYLANTITPYWNLTYGEQLAYKQKKCADIVDMLVKNSQGLKTMMTYKIDKIIPSPVTRAYRNHDEFYISPGVDGYPKTVGCILGPYTNRHMIAIRPTKIITIRESHKRVAQVYEDFIRLSDVPPSTKPDDGGHWNILTVKSNDAGEVMVIVTVKPKGYTNETIENQKQALKDYFFKHLQDVSLYYQQCNTITCHHTLAPFILLYGQRYITEVLNGYEFEIEPYTNFPNNKQSVELFYETIIKGVNMQHKSTVLDVCSGTGISTILLSNIVRRAYGFESIMEAIQQANYYAHINNVRNVQFLFGVIVRKLNAVLGSLHPLSDVVAVLNHRRIGLGKDIIGTIRRAKQVSRLVFLFIRPNSRYAFQNVIDLCSNDSSTQVPPFRLTRIIPIDLLPQTEYFELILVFEREPVTII